jgi:Na+-transporting NADH:ubiquinone oxidoreductase subunit NqrE
MAGTGHNNHAATELLMLQFLMVLHFLHKLCCLTQIFSLFDEAVVRALLLALRQVSSGEGEWFVLRGLSV